MARNQHVSFVDAWNSADAEQQEEFQQAIKKRALIWNILGLIPGVNWVFGAFSIYARNVLRAMEGKNAGGFLNLFYAVWSWILPPIAMGWLLNKMDRFCENVVLGVGGLLKDWTYED